MEDRKNKCLVDIVKSAIKEFNKEEKFLIEKDLSERCICAQYASYLKEYLKNVDSYKKYKVDVEYNRKNKEIKTMKDKKIVVDLIVHKRGQEDNLICIEMKKIRNGEDVDKIIESDIYRLKYLTSPENEYRYKFGFMLVVDEEKMEIYHTIINGKIVKKDKKKTSKEVCDWCEYADSNCRPSA